ncbi:MAG: hypothetical protein CMJ46_14235, partial [Planctomyces sp.]|nr:hypothetical protein [Planctomyces sp.]
MDCPLRRGSSQHSPRGSSREGPQQTGGFQATNGQATACLCRFGRFCSVIRADFPESPAGTGRQIRLGSQILLPCFALVPNTPLPEFSPVRILDGIHRYNGCERIEGWVPAANKKTIFFSQRPTRFCEDSLVASVNTETDTQTINGAEILVEALKHQGVKLVFAYPGGASMPLHQALRAARNDIRTILPRHEQGGGFAAQGVSRTSEDVGVCM